MNNTHLTCKICGSHSIVSKESGLLRHDAVSVGELSPTFHRNVVLSWAS
jgi:hypothetical protein